MRKAIRILKITAGIVFAPVALAVLLMLLLYLPPVQRWAVDVATQFAREHTGWDVSIGRVRLNPFLDIELQGIGIQSEELSLEAGSVILDLDFSQLYRLSLAVESVDLQQVGVDTRTMIASMQIKGSLENFHLDADAIELMEQQAVLSNASLTGADIDLQMRDTTVVDTSESAPIPWTLLLGDIAIRNSRVAFHMPNDSLSVRAAVQEARVTGGTLDLGAACYRLDSMTLQVDSMRYDLPYQPRTTGLDYNHLALSDVALRASQFSFCDGDLTFSLDDLTATERCGLQFSTVKGKITIGKKIFYLREFQLATAHSIAEANAEIPFAALEQGGAAVLAAHLTADLGAADFAMCLPGMQQFLPSGGVSLRASASGNMERMRIDTLRVMAEPWASLEASGTATRLLDSENRGAEIIYHAQTYDMRQVARMAEMQERLRIPRLTARGTVQMQGQKYTLDTQLRQADGRANLHAKYDMANDAYSLKANIRNLQLQNFLPQDSLYQLSVRARLSGRGFDPHSTAMRVAGYIYLDTLGYKHLNLGGIRANINMKQGRADVDLLARNAMLQAQACVEAEIAKRLSLAHFSLSLNKADLYGLGLVQKPFALSMLMQMDGSSNLRDRHQLRGSVRTLELALSDTTFHPQDMDVSILLNPDTTRIFAHAGDLRLTFRSPQSLDSLLARSSTLSAAVEQQLQQRELDQPLLKRLLPAMQVNLSSGTDNPAYDILKAAKGITLQSMKLQLQTDRLQGVNGEGYIHRLNTDGMQLDTISLRMEQDSTDVLGAHLHVANNAKNRQVVFRSDLKTTLAPNGIGLGLTFHDARGRKGVDLGLAVNIVDDGLRLHMSPYNPVLAYRNFKLNPDNFVMLHKDRRLEADIDLLADDGTGFKLYTMPNETALQDITLSIHDFNLGELSAVLPYLPNVEGMLGGDVHFVQDEQSVSLSVDTRVERMKYEGAALGTIGLNATYLPNADGTHFLDGIMTHDGAEVAMLSGMYDSRDGGSLDAMAALQHLPLALANGFVPNGEFALAGYADGELEVQGPVSAPVMNGHLSTDSLHINSELYSLDLRIPDDTLIVHESRLLLNRIEAYSKGVQPLVLDGVVDMRDMADVGLSLDVQARNFELINAPKTRRAIAYGKVFVDIFARLSGTLSDMQLHGMLRVLGKTDVTYVLADSPLTVEDQLADLVTFVDFTAEEDPTPVQQAKPQNIDMRLNVSIEQAAQVHCLLSPDGTNYINIEGGGDLTLSYNTLENMRLHGRYTIVSGEMNYTLMVMSLRDCTIKSGSYVEFTGDMLNPRLQLSATERVKTTVYEEKVPRSVNFEVGVELSRTLNDIGMAFTIDAPDDMAISGQLATMSKEGRGKVAVTMLATGMYLTDEGNAQGFSGANALNSFLQTQISAISNKALKSIEINFGMDNTTSATGSTQTDYNFSFAKRFWGNRISLIIGGKVSSGSDVQNTGESIVDNVSIEYRLDNTATRYVRLYYDRNTESLMEGEITEMGAGIVLRRKSTRLGELFIFKKDREKERARVQK